jgi:hypothetical protein
MKSTRLLVGTLTATLFSLGVAHAEFTWPRANTPNADTLAYRNFDGSLEGDGGSLKLTALETPTENGSKRPPAEPVFASGPSNLGQAISLKPENILSISKIKLAEAAFTVSFWVKLSGPGYIGVITNPGGQGEKSIAIGLKVDQAGKLQSMFQLGLSKYVNKSVASDLLDDQWHHIAVVVKPDAGGAGSNLKISENGNLLIDEQVDGVAAANFTLFLGAHPHEYYLPRAGLGAEMLVDELLIQGVALPEPHKPL